MTVDEFWAIINDYSAPTGDDDLCEALTSGLTELPETEIVEFDRVLLSLRDRAYRYSLWGAAYLICGGCSDDGFEYFRCWLIGQGREVYEAALSDPDSLAGYGPIQSGMSADGYVDAEWEPLIYAPRRAYESNTGREMPPVTREFPEQDQELWNFEDHEEMRRRYPRLFALLDDSKARA